MLFSLKLLSVSGEGKGISLAGIKFWYSANIRIFELIIAFQLTVEVVGEVAPLLPNPGVWSMDQSLSLLSLNDSFWNTNSIAAGVELEMTEALFSRNVFTLGLSGRPSNLSSSNAWMNRVISREIK